MKLSYLKMLHHNSVLECSISPTVKIFHPNITLNNYSPGSCPITGTFPRSNTSEGGEVGEEQQICL